MITERSENCSPCGIWHCVMLIVSDDQRTKCEASKKTKRKLRKIICSQFYCKICHMWKWCTCYINHKWILFVATGRFCLLNNLFSFFLGCFVEFVRQWASSILRPKVFHYFIFSNLFSYLIFTSLMVCFYKDNTINFFHIE